MASPAIVAGKARSDQKLASRWADASTSLHDLSGLVAAKDWAAPLKSARRFARVQVAEGGREIAWPGLGIELSAEGLWEDVHPRTSRESPWMSLEDFRGWLEGMGLTWDGAAEALGLSRRTVGYYSSGRQEVPKAVWLACMHLATRRREVAPRRLGKRSA